MDAAFSTAAVIAWCGVIASLAAVSLTLGWLRVWIGPLVGTALFLSLSMATLIVVSGSGDTRGYGASVGGPPVPLATPMLVTWAVCAVCQIVAIGLGFRPRRESRSSNDALDRETPGEPTA